MRKVAKLLDKAEDIFLAIFDKVDSLALWLRNVVMTALERWKR